MILLGNICVHQQPDLSTWPNAEPQPQPALASPEMTCYDFSRMQILTATVLHVSNLIRDVSPNSCFGVNPHSGEISALVCVRATRLKLTIVIWWCYRSFRWPLRTRTGPDLTSTQFVQFPFSSFSPMMQSSFNDPQYMQIKLLMSTSVSHATHKVNFLNFTFKLL